MEFLPDLHIAWLNGWIYLAFFYGLFGLFLLSCPKEIVKKLYSVSGWSKREYTLSAIGKTFSLACIVLMVFSPLKIGSVIFWIGLVIFLVGMVVMFIALFVYRATPVEEAVRGGIYQYSRNPQWAGLVLIFYGTAITTGNGLAMMLFTVTLFLNHFRILGEERACLAAYGKKYQEYLNSVRRYL